jgi:hypothetical protein
LQILPELEYLKYFSDLKNTQNSMFVTALDDIKNNRLFVKTLDDGKRLVSLTV